MVKIMAKHRFRNKTITMNISENTLAHAEMATPGQSEEFSKFI